MTRWTPARARGHAPGGRQAQALVMVLVLLAFLGILAYALNSVMLGFHTQVHKLSAGQASQNLALSLVAAVSAKLEAALGSDTALGQRLLSGADPSGPVTVDLSQERQLLLEDYPGATLDASAVIGAGRTLTGIDPGDHAAMGAEKARLVAGRGWDPLERRLPITITAHASWAGTDETLTVSREMAVVDVAPGTLGKFTLWAQHLLPVSGANTYAGGFDGMPAAGQPSSGLPLVLHNEGVSPANPFDRDPQSYRRRGYVFLGDETHLALSAGYTALGELWTFMPLEQLPSIQGSDLPALPVYTDANPPDFFVRTYPNPAGPSLPQYQFQIRYMSTGFYSGADAHGRTLAGAFPASSALQGQSFGQSSRLHLFGTADLPSPTLVLGKVYRDYPLVSGVLVDANNDNVMDGLLTLLPEPGDQPFPAGLPPIPAAVPGFDPGAFAGKSIPIDNTGEVTWQAMFPSPAVGYQAYASQLTRSAYMEAYNFLYRTDDASMSFYPTPPLFPGIVEPLALDRDSAPFFSTGAGALGDVGLAELAGQLREKATYRVHLADDLVGTFLSESPQGESTLSLGAVVEVEKSTSGGIELANLTVTHGGILILDDLGDIRLTNVRFDAALDFPLVLVPLAGNVVVTPGQDQTEPLPIAVIAPIGQLQVAGAGPAAGPGPAAGAPLALSGAVVVDTLDLDQVKAGGDLYYDTALDPTRPASQQPYRLMLSDAPTAW